MYPVVANSPDAGPLSYLKNDVLVIWAIGRIFNTKLYVFKELRVPQRLEIAAQRLLIIWITLTREDARFKCVAAHPAVADKNDAVHYCLLLGRLTLVSRCKSGRE